MRCGGFHPYDTAALQCWRNKNPFIFSVVDACISQSCIDVSGRNVCLRLAISCLSSVICVMRQHTCINLDELLQRMITYCHFIVFLKTFRTFADLDNACQPDLYGTVTIPKPLSRFPAIFYSHTEGAVMNDATTRWKHFSDDGVWLSSYFSWLASIPTCLGYDVFVPKLTVKPHGLGWSILIFGRLQNLKNGFLEYFQPENFWSP